MIGGGEDTSPKYECHLIEQKVEQLIGVARIVYLLY